MIFIKEILYVTKCSASLWCQGPQTNLWEPHHYMHCWRFPSSPGDCLGLELVNEFHGDFISYVSPWSFVLLFFWFDLKVTHAFGNLESYNKCIIPLSFIKKSVLAVLWVAKTKYEMKEQNILDGNN